MIAEEVGAVVPEIVSWESNGTDAQGVDYTRLSALLIEAVKQQQQEISALESKLTQIEQDRSQTQLATARPSR